VNWHLRFCISFALYNPHAQKPLVVGRLPLSEKIQRVRELARRIVEEKDPEVFTAPVQEMNDLLDELQEKPKPPTTGK
jgi:hypothetical protein